MVKCLALLIFLATPAFCNFPLDEVTLDYRLDMDSCDLRLEGPLKGIHAIIVDRLEDLRRDRLYELYNNGTIDEITLNRHIPPIYENYWRSRRPVELGKSFAILNTEIFTLLNTGAVSIAYPRLTIDSDDNSASLLFVKNEPKVKRGLTISFQPDASITTRPPYINNVSCELSIFYYKGSTRYISCSIAAIYKINSGEIIAQLSIKLLQW